MANLLREAVQNGDHEAARQLIQAGHNVSEILCICQTHRIVNLSPTEFYEESLLQLAARLGDVDMINILIEAGAPLDEEYYFQVPNDGTYHGRAMDVASCYGHVQVIEALEAAGSSVVSLEYNSDGMCPMVMAAKNGHVDAVETISELACNGFEDSHDHLEAFSYALMHCQYDCIAYFLDQGADVDREPLSHDCTPMHYVFRRYRFCHEAGHNVPINKSDEDVMKCINILLEYGADTNYLTTHCETDYSLLCAAIIHRQVEVVKRLLQAGAEIPRLANPNASLIKSKHFGILPLHCAISSADPRCLKVLLDAGAGSQIHARVIRRYEPTVRDEYFDNIVGRPAEDREDYIFFPLHVFGEEGDSVGDEIMRDGDADQVLAMLLQAGANLEVRTSKNETPLHTCCTSSTGTIDIIDRATHACMSALLRAGANVHALDNKNRTPLHRVLITLDRLGRSSFTKENESFRWGCEIIYDLICHGSDIHRQDDEGVTPLRLIEQRVAALNAHGPRAKAAERRWMTPIFMELVAAGQHRFFQEIEYNIQQDITRIFTSLGRSVPGQREAHWIAASLRRT